MGCVGNEERFPRSRNIEKGNRTTLSPGVGAYNINQFSSYSKAAGTTFDYDKIDIISKTV